VLLQKAKIEERRIVEYRVTLEVTFVLELGAFQRTPPASAAGAAGGPVIGSWLTGRNQTGGAATQ
jgi:hypothetical protein